MKQYVLTENLDTLTGMRLAGVDGTLITEDVDFSDIFAKVIEQSEIGLVLISPKLIEKNQDLINEVRFNRSTPLITSALGPDEWQKQDDTLSATIQQAIGIQL